MTTEYGAYLAMPTNYSAWTSTVTIQPRQKPDVILSGLMSAKDLKALTYQAISNLTDVIVRKKRTLKSLLYGHL